MKIEGRATPPAEPCRADRGFALNMAIEFKLPELGENVTSGDITRVLVKVGDAVKKDQPVLEMETGKATVEIPCPEAGVIKAIHVREGQKAAVGVLVLTLDPSGASAAPAPAAAAPKAAPAAPVAAPAPAPAPVARPAVRTVPPPAPAAPVVAGTGRAVPAAPSTRQFAREIGLDVAQVAGSGPGGRISVDDVKAHARAVMARGPAAGPAAPPALPDFGKYGAIERQALSNVRQATAQAMAISWSNVPRVVLHDKADITDLEKFRQDSKGRADKAGAKLTLTAFLIKICGSALKQFPQFQRQPRPGAQRAGAEEVRERRRGHGHRNGPAGAGHPRRRPQGRDQALALEWERRRAAQGDRKISPADMEGGTFTISNLGGIGGTAFFTPIVNYAPQVAILGVSRGP
jgi:pyruvate dehydrogenase E2 component (dihydrolipoamide acetyltransferase)